MASRSKASGELRYDVHPSYAMVANWIASLKEKTGRSLDEWMKHIKKNGPATESERRDWLKSDHGLGTNAAWWLAERSVGKGWEEDTPEGYLEMAEKYVEAQYAGKKSDLRSLYEQLVRLGRSIARDVKVCPCKTMVPLFRHHVIAQIKPSTNSRIDLGLALGDRKPSGRLIDTGGFAKKDRITHRIPIGSLEDIDDEVLKWMKTAYALDNKKK